MLEAPDSYATSPNKEVMKMTTTNRSVITERLYIDVKHDFKRKKKNNPRRSR